MERRWKAAGDAREALAAAGIMSEAEARSSDVPATRAELARWLVRAKGWELVRVAHPCYDDVPPDDPDAPYIETLAAHRIDSRLWSDPASSQGARPEEQTNEEKGSAPDDSSVAPKPVYPTPYPPFPISRHLFHPQAPLSHADFAEALFLAARDISPLFAELPGPAVWETPGNAGSRS